MRKFLVTFEGGRERRGGGGGERERERESTVIREIVFSVNSRLGHTQIDGDRELERVEERERQREREGGGWWEEGWMECE